MTSLERAGCGTITGMFLVGRKQPRFDPASFHGRGDGSDGPFAVAVMSRYSLLMDSWPVIIAGVFQGAGIGAVNVCLSTVGLVTLPAKLPQ